MQYRWLDAAFLPESRFAPVVVACFSNKHPGLPPGQTFNMRKELYGNRYC